MATPSYAQRIGRLPEVFEVLAAHPDGLRLTELAARFGAPAEQLREDLLAFFTADVNGLLGLTRPSVLEFLGEDGDDVDPQRAEVVRIVEERPAEELGVEYVDAAELALIYTSALALLDLEPSNADLAAALDVLTETMYGEADAPDAVGDSALSALRAAVEERRQVRIVYSRSWQPGVAERVIEPYRLLRTRRGWEVDAGPVTADGSIRTYLLSNVRSAEALPSTFALPATLPALLKAQRTTTVVRVRIPHSARWAADMYAEVVRVVVDDESTVTLDLELLPPVDRRLGLLLLAAGPDAAVLSPAALVASVSSLAAELLEHHRR